MAVSPKAATELTAEEVLLVNELEQKIDLFLQGEYEGCGEHTVPPSFPLPKKEIRGPALKELRRRYIAAGWKRVEFNPAEYGQHDNCSLPACLLFYDKKQE